MNEKKIKESKKHIQILAELCIDEIYENKFLLEKNEFYNKHINYIKEILINKTDIKQQIKKFHDSLISSNNNLKKGNKILKTKLDSYKDNLSLDENKNKLINIKSDNLILMYQIKEKEDIINSLNKSIESLRKNIYFKESKREIEVNNKWGQYYITLNLNDQVQKLMIQCQNFIQYNNKCFKKQKEKNSIKNKIQDYKNMIKYYQDIIGDDIKNNKIKENNKNKKNNNKINNKKLLSQTLILKNEKELSLFDDKLNNNNYLDENLIIDKEKEKKYNEDKINNNKNKDKDISIIDKYISGEIRKNKKIKKESKIEFLTVDELFDINNHEGKAEEIIDDELHSDDDIIFELKIKPLKKIGIHYYPKIKKQIPLINLSQIEYNKQKVINEADLYSLQKRKFKYQNIDENIKTMNKKVKKYKHICKLNKKKVKVFENYAKNIENNYKALKPLKIQSSLGGVKIPKIQKFFENENNFDIDNIDLGDDDSDNLDEDNDNDDNHNNIIYNETYSGNKLSKNDLINLNNVNLKDIKGFSLKDNNNNIKQKNSVSSIDTKSNNNKLVRANSK